MIYYACVKFPNTEYLKFDYQAIIVASLSLITAVLLGWQIYQVIYIDKIVQHKIEKSISSYDDMVNELVTKNEIDFLNYLMAIAYKNRDYDLTFYYATRIPKHLRKMKNLEASYLNDKVIKKLKEAIWQLKEEEEEQELDPDDLKRLIHAYKPFAHFDFVYEFLGLCENLRANIDVKTEIEAIPVESNDIAQASSLSTETNKIAQKAIKRSKWAIGISIISIVVSILAVLVSLLVR